MFVLFEDILAPLNFNLGIRDVLKLGDMGYPSSLDMVKFIYSDFRICKISSLCVRIYKLFQCLKCMDLIFDKFCQF